MFKAKDSGLMEMNLYSLHQKVHLRGRKAIQCVLKDRHDSIYFDFINHHHKQTQTKNHL